MTKKLVSFKRRCLRCSKKFNHRHTPAEFNTPCVLCGCAYFYGWEQWMKARGITKEADQREFWKHHRKPEEKVEELDTRRSFEK